MLSYQGVNRGRGENLVGKNEKERYVVCGRHELRRKGNELRARATGYVHLQNSRLSFYFLHFLFLGSASVSIVFNPPTPPLPKKSSC